MNAIINNISTTIKALQKFEHRDFVEIFKTVRGETMIQPHGWFAIEGTQVVWYKPEEHQAKLLDMVIDEDDEPIIEHLSFAEAEERVNAMRKKGLKILVGPATEQTPAGMYITL